VKVAITPDTKIEGDIQLKSQVRVEGRTQPDGVVLADKIKVVSSNFDEDGNPARNNSNSTPDGQGSDHGNNGSEDNKSGKTELPEINRTETPESMDKPSPAHSTPEKDKLTPETRKFEIEGNVISYNGSLIEVAGRTIFVIPETELRGSPSSGSTVYIRGYINQNGDLIALRIEVKSPSRTGGDGGQNGGGDSGGSDGHEPTRTPEPGKTPDD
jgi:hypothetical protein